VTHPLSFESYTMVAFTFLLIFAGAQILIAAGLKIYLVRHFSR